ncbi:MAG TPA: dTDP-glucose 4,6-dehydratase [Patescibacteria group bacterium]|nr:dTDP-glucose 4,6-dehydratase [Patescibacteria group bacterium]
MKLLVTGGAGFIGSNFISYWVKKYPYDSIVNFDKLTYAGSLDNLIEIQNYPNYHFVKGDITNRSLVDTVMKETEVVVHFAAESHVDRSIHDPSAFILTNIVGTHTLLESAVAHRIKRFHHISTDEVFGSLELSSKELFHEKTPYNPRSPYAASKASSDHLVRVYHITFQLPITISNCSNNFGPFQFPEKLISLAITNILRGKKVPLYGDGLYMRDWLYVEDHIHALELILHSGKIGETYLIGGLTQDISNKDVVMKILSLMKKDTSSISYVDDRLGHDRRYAIDWSKIKHELGWHPQHNFDTALQKTIRWYTDHEHWWKTKSS